MEQSRGEPEMRTAERVVDVVEPDEDPKAATVSNLLVVVCREQAAQQVVNAGSLYQ
jgi:hypothetical protein